MKNLLFYISIFLAYGSLAQNYEVEKCKLSTTYDEYCAGIHQNSVIFSSNKKSEVFITHMDEDDNYYSNLYTAKEENGKFAQKGELFSEQITSALNEGSLSFSPDGKTVWYTSNITKENQKIRYGQEFKLGIFKAEKIDNIWTKTGAFPFNSDNQKYNVAHPTISPDGMFMIFSSDKEGGVGETDLWISKMESGAWGEPECLAEGINTPKKEMFPFIDENNILFFSSNGFKEEMDLDVYKIKIENIGTHAPKKLKAPINSEFDDYGFIPKLGGEEGYFSSNRESSDDIFEFKYLYPEFVDCQENYDPSLCYIIEESNMDYIDTLPLAYVWDLGDGTKKQGFTVEHCFPDSGTYDISLNIIDTISGVTFASVNNLQLIIELPNQPYITSKDTLFVNNDYTFSSLESQLDWHTVEEWFWDMGEGKTLKGEEIIYSYEQAGIYYVTLGALSEPDESGFQHQICAYKEIIVLNDEEQLLALREEEKILEQQREEEEALLLEEALSLEEEGLLEQAKAKEEEAKSLNDDLTLDYDYMSDTELDADNVEESIVDEEIESTFFVDVLESEEQMSIEDEYFEKLKYEITERFDEKDSLFIYSVGQAEDVFALWDIYQEVLDSGYYSAIVKQERLKSFKEQIENIGYHIPEDEPSNEVVEDEWNRTITNFANIQFDSNSSRITAESMKSLDYIAVMMEIEEDFNLEINAYTDDKGNADYNQTLSERRADAVKRYLIRKGVSAKRLSAAGFGEENPISDNLTELGRTINRRVEFRILSEMFK